MVRRSVPSTGGVRLTWPGRGDTTGGDLSSGDTEVAGEERGMRRVEVIGLGGNRVIAADNLAALRTPVDAGGLAGVEADLVYIDPPYAMGRDFRAEWRLDGRARGEVVGAAAYSDRHHGGLAGYLQMMAPRLEALIEVLAPTGFLFVQCDWRADAALRLLLDELLGPACFRNVITWRRAPNLGRQAASAQLGRVTDSILVYSRRPGTPFPGPTPTRRELARPRADGTPMGARWDPERQAWFTTAPRGDYTDASVARLEAEGRIHRTPSGSVYIKYFLTEGPDGWYREQRIDCLWDDEEVRPLRHRPKHEHQGYETQKPEGLLERILGWASPEGGLVVDTFCGSGTTAAVAHRLGRRFMVVDAGEVAVRVTRRRLLEAGVPFEVYAAQPDAAQPDAAQPDAAQGPTMVAADRESARVGASGAGPAVRVRARRMADGSVVLEADESVRLWPEADGGSQGRSAEPGRGLGLVESWAVGTIDPDGTRRPVWWAVRPRDGRAEGILTNTPPLIAPPAPTGSAATVVPELGVDVVAHVVDVYGGEVVLAVEDV